jgi:hypothetical protein
MCQKGGSDWTNIVSNDLAHWFTLPDALDGQPNSTWDGGVCDGTVSFPNLGKAPYDGTAPVMLYGPDCGGPLPPLPPPPANRSVGVASGDYPRAAVALPLHVDDPYLRNWTRPNGDPVTFDGVPCSFPGRVWRSDRPSSNNASAAAAVFNMLCAWDGRTPWSRFSTSDPSLLTGWKLQDKKFATGITLGTRFIAGIYNDKNTSQKRGTIYQDRPWTAIGVPNRVIRAYSF